MGYPKFSMGMLFLLAFKSSLALAFIDVTCVTGDGKVKAYITHEPSVDILFVKDSGSEESRTQYKNIDALIKSGNLSYVGNSRKEYRVNDRINNQVERYEFTVSMATGEGEGFWYLNYDGYIFGPDPFQFSFQCHDSKYSDIFQALSAAAIELADLLYQSDYAQYYSNTERSLSLKVEYQKKLADTLHLIQTSVSSGGLNQDKVDQFFERSRTTAVDKNHFDAEKEKAAQQSKELKEKREKEEEIKRKEYEAAFDREIRAMKEQRLSLDKEHQIEFDVKSESIFKTIQFHEVTDADSIFYVSDLITQFQWARISAVKNFSIQYMEPESYPTYYRERGINRSENIFGVGTYSVLFDHFASALLKPDMPVERISTYEVNDFLKFLSKVESDGIAYEKQIVRQVFPDFGVTFKIFRCDLPTSKELTLAFSSGKIFRDADVRYDFTKEDRSSPSINAWRDTGFRLLCRSPIRPK